MKQEKLPKGSLEVFKALENKGALTQSELITELKAKKPRAVRYTIRTLMEKELLVSYPNFEDMRSSLISINETLKEFVFNVLNTSKIKIE